MKILSQDHINLVSGGKCTEFYTAEVPLNYLPIIAKHLKMLNAHTFDATAMLQELSDAGLDTTKVYLEAGVFC